MTTPPSFVRSSGVGPERPTSDLRAIREMLYGRADLEEEARIQAARYRRTPDFDCHFYCTDYRHVLGCPTAKRDMRDRKLHEKAFDDYIEAMGQ